MPPRQRSSAARRRPQEPPEPAAAATPANEPPQVGEEDGRRVRRRKKVEWWPVFRRMGYFSLLFLIPALLNYAALNHEFRTLLDKAGTLYDIGWDQKLLLNCTGIGLPTVILEAPIGQSSNVWGLVQPIIARHTRVCSYDRAGIGFSDRAYQNTSEYANDFSEAAMLRDRTKPSTVERMVEDLHKLVSQSSNQPKPLLLVSSDFSSFIARFYSQLYEHEVAGLLLIDPAIESLFDYDEEEEEEEEDSSDPSYDTNSNTTASDKEEREEREEREKVTWSQYWHRRVIPYFSSMQISASVGFNRISLMVGLMSSVEEPQMKQLLREEMITIKKYLLCQPKHISSAVAEYLFMNESMSQIKTMFQVKPFPEYIPITMATYKEGGSELTPELKKAWVKGRSRLTGSIHPGAKRVILPGVDYISYYLHPKAVAEVILSMVTQWRKDSKIAA